jgi:hypothetical protein
VDAAIWFPEGGIANSEDVFIRRVAAAFPFRLNYLNKVLSTKSSSPNSLRAVLEKSGNPWRRMPQWFLDFTGLAITAISDRNLIYASKWWDRLRDDITTLEVRKIFALTTAVPVAVSPVQPLGQPKPTQVATEEATHGAVRSYEPLKTLGEIVRHPLAPKGLQLESIVYVGWEAEECQGFVRRWAESVGRPYAFASIDAEFFQSADVIKRAGFVVIWNGGHGSGRNAKALCESMKIPYAFFEWGVAPQGSTFLVDLKGFAGESMLMDSLGWVTDADIAAYRVASAGFRAPYKLFPQPRSVLVPLQIENDTQVVYNSHYRGMNELIGAVVDAYPGADITVRPHPKSGNQKPSVPTGIKVQTAKDEPDWLRAASHAELIVGVNSTALTEAAMLGVPVVALGRCPLAVQPKRHRERLLAAYWALRVPRVGGHIGAVIKRFGIAPI